jgi:hypothetical protein
VKLKQILILLFSLALASPAIAQGYQKDSLQIKVYTEIEYEQYRVKSIKATRVFCDYCSENQTKKIKEEALRLAYLARNNRDYILEKGIKKLAMYIRVSKKDFAVLKEDEPDN